MRTRTILGLGACGLFLIGVAEAQQAVRGQGQAKERRSAFTDADFGYSLQLPRFTPPSKPVASVAPAVFAGAIENGFASNVGVTIHPKATNLKDFRAETVKELKQLGQIIKEARDIKVSGRDALWLDFVGDFQGRSLHFLSLAVVDKLRVIQVTCTTTAEDYPRLGPEFRACLDSMRLPE